MCYQEAELSARNAAHRSERAFQDVVRAASVVLKKATVSGLDGGSSGAKDAAAAKGGSRRAATQFQRAYALQRLRQFEDAVRDYDVCATQEPTRALVFYNRGCALYALGRREDAVQDLTRAIKLDAKNMLFIESRATVLKELGRFHDAIHDYAWLEALRRTASKPVPGSLPSPTAGERARAEDSDSVSTRHGSFSAQLEDFSASFQSETPTVGSVQMNAANGERESRARGRFLRFLKLNPVARSPSDLQEAVAYAKSWSFFRGMTKDMVEQCLEEATYGHFEAEQVVVEQGVRPQAFHVVLNTVASLVKNVDVHGVSKVRELKTLCQGDAVGADPFTLSFADGTLRTLRHVAAAIPPDARSKSPTRFHGASALTGRVDGMSRSTPTSSSSKATVSDSDRGGTDHGGDGDETLLPLEPASYSCLDEVHCLVLSTDVYRSILHEREEAELEERMQFLRSCRVFQNCTNDVLTALAVLSSRKVYDPGRNILSAGDIVTQLCLIKRGVCQVRKTITVSRHLPSTSASSKKASQSTAADDLLTSRSSDGSWVLDNGWMLTNPRLVNNAQQNSKSEQFVTQQVDVAILASGQMFGELSVLQPGEPSQVTIRTQTLVEILVLQERDLARLNVQFQSGTMNALQDSLLFHNPPQQKIIQLHRELDAWEKEKRGVLDEFFNSSPLLTSKSTPSLRSTNRLPPTPALRPSSRQRLQSREAAKKFKLSPLKKMQQH